MLGPFGVEIISKSYINGAWRPITSMPKSQVKEFKEGGLFGGSHLKEVSDSRRFYGKMVEKPVQRMEDSLKGEKLKRFEHPLASKNTVHAPKKLQSQYKSFGPSVQSGLGGRNVVRGLKDGQPSEKFLSGKEWRANRRYARRYFGSKAASSDGGEITAHEAAHARPRRKKSPFFVDMAMRSLNRSMDETSKRPNKNWDDFNDRQTLSHYKHLDRLNTREEAHADVIASRFLNKPVVSGHWHEKGYLDDRNMIARGMKQPKLKLLKKKKK